MRTKFFLGFLWFILTFAYSAVEIFEYQKNNVVFYFLKVNHAEYKIFYLPKYRDSARIKRIFEKVVFSNEPVIYEIKYDSKKGSYKILLNKNELFCFDKNIAYELGYSNLRDLAESYKRNLDNLKYLPEVFFSKGYIEALVNQETQIGIFNKTGKNFILNLPEYCYYVDSKVIVRSDKPVFQQVISIDYPGGQDISYITVKVPTFEIAYTQNIVKFKNYYMLENLDWFKMLVYPNVKVNTEVDLKYSIKQSRNKFNFFIYTRGSSFPFKDVKKNYQIVFNREKEKTGGLEFDYLIILNNPEKISTRGIIFESEVLENHGYWIWFHHQFDADLNYCIEIENIQNIDVNLEFFSSLNKSRNEVETGIKSSYKFFEFLKNKDTLEINLLPKQKFRVVIEKGYINQVLTGFVYFKSSKFLNLKVFAYDKVLPSEAVFPDGTSRTTGKFHKPLIIKEFYYKTSKNFESFKIPDKEIVSSKYGKNYSNYGVLYKIIFKLYNDKDSVQQVNIYFSSISGYTPFIFFKDNGIFKINSGMYKKLFSISLFPKQSIEIPISFLITPGLSYPIEFEITGANL